MESGILDTIPVQIDESVVMKRAHIRPDSPYAGDLHRMIEEASRVAKPKACYRLALIEERGPDWLMMDRIRFTSRVLVVNLEKTHRVFAYLGTCGMEVENWSRGVKDLLAEFWADTIKEVLLSLALEELARHLDGTFKLAKTADMSPGSLENWPIQQQTPLFTLLGDLVPAIGVRLTESLLMVPTKTVSGIRFATEESFASCQLCPRQNCPGRRLPYQPELYEAKYGIKNR